MRIVLVNDTSGCSNWGDRAAGISLRAMMAAEGHEIVAAFTEDDIAHTRFARQAPAGLDEEAEPGDLTRGLAKQLLPPVAADGLRKLVRRSERAATGRLIPEEWGEFEDNASRIVGDAGPWPALVGAMKEADAVFIHGDGAFGDSFGIAPRTLLFLAYIARRRLGKPVVLANHTADLDDPRLLELARRVYPLLDDVVFRDPVSLERCREFCRGRYAADTAFWFTPAPRESWLALAGRPTYFDVWPDTAGFDPSRPYLCVGGSSVYGVRGERGEIVRGYVALVERLRASYAGQVVLVASDLVDERVLRPVARSLGLPLLGARMSVQQAVDVLGNADAYVGGRWHAGIFALRGGTPIVPFSSRTFKMQALAGSAGLETVAFDALELGVSAALVADALRQLLAQGAALRTKLRSWADERAVNCWDNLTYLRGRSV
jgi:hypothetical protein